mgnify:CR=1 FL=1
MIGRLLTFAAIASAAKAQGLVREVRSGLSVPPYTLAPERRVSLCVPAHQEEKYIGTLIRSAHNQTYPFHDLVVADTGVDGAAHLARNFDALVVTAPYGNIGASRNLAASYSQGEILVFADADMLLHAQFVERAVAALEQGAALVHPRTVFYDSAGWNLSFFPLQAFRPYWVTSGCVAVWRDVYEAVGGYDELCNPMAPLGERCAEDQEFGHQVAAAYGRESIKLLPWLVGTSARRWKAQGVSREHFEIPVRARLHRR